MGSGSGQIQNRIKYTILKYTDLEFLLQLPFKNCFYCSLLTLKFSSLEHFSTQLPIQKGTTTVKKLALGIYEKNVSLGACFNESVETANCKRNGHY